MPATSVRKTQTTAIARPLKVLTPLIQQELVAGNEAGLEHYANAGELLLEAKGQVPLGGWSRWLKKNFELSHATAGRYMRLAVKLREGNTPTTGRSIEDVLGEAPRKKRHALWGKIRDVADKVDVARLNEEKQERQKELKLHQDIALKLIDLGYRAMATRLHPDRGGSRDAMSRLNTVRDELKEVAATRRFV